MTSALQRGEGGSRKVDKSTDKLHDHVCDKGGGRLSKNSKFSWTSLMEAPLCEIVGKWHVSNDHPVAVG